MIKNKEKISIDEFDGKRYQVRLVEPNENGKAVLTHYLHNIHNGVSKYYKDDALEVLNDFVTYKQEEEKLSKLITTEFFVCDDEEEKLFDIGTLSRV